MLRVPKIHYFLLLLAASLSLNAACSSCVKTPTAPGQDAQPPVTPTVSVLPFSTKEPNLYQAEIVISLPGANAANEQKYFIARDGEKRRIDYEVSAKETMSVVENEAGKTIILLPQKKCSTEERPAGDNSAAVPSESFADFLTNGWLAEKFPVNFEDLGKETLNGRSLAKFRIHYEKMNGVESTSEALVWVDEEIGMPVRTEFYSLTNGQRSSAIVTEFRKIKLSIDAGVFDKPASCQNITAQEMQTLLRKERLDAE